MTLRDNDCEISNNIAHRLIKELLAKGYNISVNDDGLEGGDVVLSESTNAVDIENALYTTESDSLIIQDGKTIIGSILLIWGNDEDVISNHTFDDRITSIVDRILDLN